MESCPSTSSLLLLPLLSLSLARNFCRLSLACDLTLPVPVEHYSYLAACAWSSSVLRALQDTTTCWRCHRAALASYFSTTAFFAAHPGSLFSSFYLYRDSSVRIRCDSGCPCRSQTSASVCWVLVCRRAVCYCSILLPSTTTVCTSTPSAASRRCLRFPASSLRHRLRQPTNLLLLSPPMLLATQGYLIFGCSSSPWWSAWSLLRWMPLAYGLLSDAQHGVHHVLGPTHAASMCDAAVLVVWLW